MSILTMLAAAVPVSQPTSVPFAPEQQWLGAAIFVVPALIVATLAGVFRRRSINGPTRVGAELPITPLFVATVIGGGSWFFIQAAYGGARAAHHMSTHHGERFDASAFGEFDYAFLATVPGLIGLAVLVIADVMTKQELPRRLGYTLEGLPGALLRGLLGAIIVLPLVWGMGGLLEMLYRAIRYTHPSEHELLGAMKDASMLMRVILALGACVVAPLFEEVFFRGHIQTVLTRMFAKKLAAPPLPWDTLQSTVPTLEYRRPDVVTAMDAVPQRRFVWLAVIITSMLFAAVHPLWTAPLIFVLSVCLGYAYERTGKLWVSVVIHAIFNTFSTIVFLNLR